MKYKPIVLPLLLFFAILVLLLLRAAFPDAVITIDEGLRILYVVVMLVLIYGMSGMVRQQPRQKILRDGLIWLGIVIVLVLSYYCMNFIKGS